MPEPLTNKYEYQLTSSALLDSDIITLPQVTSRTSSPPTALTAARRLPCEPRFLIRLRDGPEGRSRWTTPEAARNAEMASRIWPPYHPSARNVQGALEAMTASEAAQRSVQADLQRQAEAQRRAERERNRPAFIVADAANGTAYVQSTMPNSPRRVEDDGEEVAATHGAPQEAEENAVGGEEYEEDAAAEIGLDSMPHVGASCQRCLERKTRCNRRRPCQFCLQDGIGEGDCFLPRGSDSPEAIPTRARKTVQQPAVAQAAGPVAANDSKIRKGPGRLPKKRKWSSTSNFPVEVPPVAPVPSLPAAVPAPAPSATGPAPNAPPAPSTPAEDRPKKKPTGRKPKLSSPLPHRGNFLNDEEKRENDAWRERHKDR